MGNKEELGVGVDEDLSMEERRIRWKLVERARTERARRRIVVTTNRRIWMTERLGGGICWERSGMRRQRRQRRRGMVRRKG